MKGKGVKSEPPPAPLPDSQRAALIVPVPSREEIEARVALDDHTGACELARARLEAYPDEVETQQTVERGEATLMQMYMARLGDCSRQVRVLMSGERLQWLSIDHRAGFMVSRIVGSTTVEELLELSPMRRLDALRILYDLVQQKVIELVDEP